MTKTIEFVEKSIEKQTKKIEELKEQKEHYEILHKSCSIISYTPQIVSIDLEIENIEFNLEHIKQIKCELEAWEVVKKCLSISIDSWDEFSESFEFISFTVAGIHPLLGFNRQEIESVKKALEAEE